MYMLPYITPQITASSQIVDGEFAELPAQIPGIAEMLLRVNNIVIVFNVTSTYKEHLLMFLTL